MIVTIKPKNGKPIKKSFSDPQKAIEWINSTTAEHAAQQNVQADLLSCAHPQNETVYDAVIKAVTCGVCGASR